MKEKLTHPPSNRKKKKKIKVARKMAQRLKTHVALEEDPSSVPSKTKYSYMQK